MMTTDSLHACDFCKEVHNFLTQGTELQVDQALICRTDGCRDRNRLDSHKPHSANLKKKCSVSQLKSQ